MPARTCAPLFLLAFVLAPAGVIAQGAPPPPAPAAAAGPAAESGVEGTEAEAPPREVTATKLRIGDIADMGFHVRLQPRLDYGDLVVSQDGKTYDREQDLYLRRVRFTVTGSALGQLHYVLTLAGDRVGQKNRPNAVTVTDAAVEWRAAEWFAMRVGRAKLPITRSGFTSSARQLLVDRPLSVDAARGLFDDVNQPNLLLRSRLLGGAVALYAAVADGWNGTGPYSSSPGKTVRTSHPAVVARVELSPPGLTEAHKSDSHLGEGKHLTVGADAGLQEQIQYGDATGKEDRRLVGVDLSSHVGPLTLQGEARWWEIRSVGSTRGTVKPYGVYGQAGYYIAPIGLEPVARYELYVEDSTKSGARQTVLTVGLNAYLHRHSAKLQLAWVHRAFEAHATGVLPGQDAADVAQAQVQLYL
ncbi:MAG TPA: porin [Anaeromyxobacteraceae bacterium]|nr:porin [Anaeromyxobacteraceae bacterium]